MAGHLRWGFLGSGFIAGLVASDFEIAGLKITAFASETSNKSQALAEKYGAKSFNSYEALVSSSEIDAVYVNTIHPKHLDHAKLAISAGKHVLLEKPFTINAREAQEIANLAKAMKVFVLEAMWTRFLPMHQTLFNELGTGAIGVPYLVMADHSQFLPHVPRLIQRKLGGGALLDLGIYPIHFAERVLGRPSKISAFGHLNNDAIDETVAINFQYKNGALAALTTSANCAGPITATILGTKGRIEISRSFYEQSSFAIFDQDNKVISAYNEKISGTGRQYQAIELENCVKDNLLESKILPLAKTVEIMQIMDEIRSEIGVTYPWAD